MRRIALVALLLLAAAALAGVGRPEHASALDEPAAPAAAPAESSVTVSGNGSVRAVPDRARISFGVETQSETARAALAANAAEMRQVLDALRRAGVRELATDAVSVSPRYADGAAISGYAAVNTVSGTIAVERAGAVIDAAVAAGANQVYGPSLAVGDAERLYRDALELAVADARARAEVLAAAAGLSLGRATAIVEGGSPVPVPLAEAKAVGDASTPIEAGSRETTATVTVTFAAS